MAKISRATSMDHEPRSTKSPLNRKGLGVHFSPKKTKDWLSEGRKEDSNYISAFRQIKHYCIRRPLCFGWGGGAREAWSIDCLACLPSHQRDRLRAMYPFPSLFAAGSKVGSLFDAYGHVHPSAMFPPAGVLLYCLWRFEQPRRIDEPSLQRHMLALLRTMYPTNVCLSFVPHPSTFVFSGFENG